ncbi:hypothetical protein TPHA_0D02800 [Tetrapisispora phaffii CBS 4417]|uniref:Trafficking protein particle complex subunit n=1 Tax=Tetrapisispora phaffii (strain ATCC 24235 / CBS 4417 / NBRC 1672 / NRRL Y-8282 / UCD 70-5) TaxID=1071381 RepID=G8BSU5_TETPH|nr:hypothetical protein TPHA_0D02800 [Tetrapisispora phaffii CBS 4417]CCE62916.1 hypothetical protein TPHA_0D02800 [Tetrapisispora phaffii CBS 4417]
MTDKLILTGMPEEQNVHSTTGYEYIIGPKQSLPNEANAPYIPSKIYSESILYKKQQVSLMSMAFLYQELISQIYKNSKTSTEFETKLSNHGSNIGFKLLDLLNLRASVPSSARSSTFLPSNASLTGGNTGETGGASTNTNTSTILTGYIDKSYESNESLSNMISQLRRRDLKIIDILQFIHGSVWSYLFGAPSNDLVKSSERENEYMIVDNEPVLTQFISGNFSCNYFMCGLIKGFLSQAGFECTVSPHPDVDEIYPNRVVYLIKFEKQVLEREALKFGA